MLSSATSCTRPVRGQRATSRRARVVFPAPLCPSMSTTGFDTPSSRTASRTRAAAVSRGAATGSALLLEGADDTAERTPGYPHEGDRDGQKRDDVRLEADVSPTPDVCADWHGVAASATSAVAGLVGAAAETCPAERHRDDLHASHIALFAVGGVDAEGCRLLAELECDVGHEPTLPVRPGDAQGQPGRAVNRVVAWGGRAAPCHRASTPGE